MTDAWLKPEEKKLISGLFTTVGVGAFLGTHLWTSMNPVLAGGPCLLIGTVLLCRLAWEHVKSARPWLNPEGDSERD